MSDTYSTSVPQPVFGPQGFVPPTENEIYDGVIADMNAAFGGNLDTDPETPQGQLASSFTAEIGAQNDQFLAYVNGVDPALNSGRMQDAIGRIYFLSRIAAAPTVVTCTCAGLAGTIIPTGALAQDSDGNIYYCTGGGTIPASGSVSLQFANQVTGPIPCPATSLSTIYQAQPGWDSITNPADGVLGRNVETRQAFEARREASVELNARAVVSSIRANVLAVPDVLDCYATENPTGSPVTELGVTLSAHSLYVCVAGGDPLAVATAIWQKKPPGCAYNGDTTETVYDSNSGYSPPYPSYSVTFQTAIDTPIVVGVTIIGGPDVPSNAQTLIQNAVVNAFAGEDGGPAAQIGSLLRALRYYPPIAAIGPWVRVVAIVLGSQNSPAASFTGSIAGTTLTASSITGAIAVGQVLVGANVPDGTTILSGSGSTWTISATLTVTSEQMYGISPSLSEIQMNINQEPVISANNITVTVD